jgi:hypothetical protein
MVVESDLNLNSNRRLIAGKEMEGEGWPAREKEGAGRWLMKSTKICKSQNKQIKALK